MRLMSQWVTEAMITLHARRTLAIVADAAVVSTLMTPLQANPMRAVGEASLSAPM